MKNIFIQNLPKNEPGRLVPDLFLFFKKALYDDDELFLWYG